MALSRERDAQGRKALPPILLAQRFTTTTSPPVGPNTHVVAATHPSLATAAYDDDGWFVADFFCFCVQLSVEGPGAVTDVASDGGSPNTLSLYQTTFIHAC
jgi:hypothetical protein